MKKIIYCVIFLFVSHLLNAQDATHVKVKYKSGNEVAKDIADKMYGLLELSNSQQGKILQINHDLLNQKKRAYKLSQDRTHVMRSLQRIEDSRDSLYATVLTRQQLTLYKQKKKYIISIN